MDGWGGERTDGWMVAWMGGAVGVWMEEVDGQCLWKSERKL